VPSGSRTLSAGESVIAQARWQLWGDDALESGGFTTGWPSRSGPSAILKAPPWTAPGVTTVAARNNKKALVFTRGMNTVLDVDGDVNPVAGDHSLGLFIQPYAPSHESTTAHREYIISCDYNAQGRLIFAHNSNDGLIANTYRHPGFYNAANDGDITGFWHIYDRVDNGNPKVHAIAGPQFRLDILASGAGGVSKFWRDGVLIGTNVGHYLTTRAFAKGTGIHRIGTETTAVPDATNVTDLGALLYCVLYWDWALTDQQAQDVASVVMPYYDWTARPYLLPNERAGLQAWYSSAKNVVAGTAVPVASPVAWPDITARMSMLAGSMGVVDGAADFTPNQDLSRSSALTNWVSAASYSRYTVAIVRSSSTTSGTTNANDAVYCDSLGRYGLHVRDTGGGTFEARAYHTDGVQKAATVTGLQYGVKYLFIARYDGVTDTLYLQVNDGTIQQTTGVGSITATDGSLSFAGRPADITVQFDGRIYEDAPFNTFHANATVAQTRTFFELQRDAA
jgi:hypothetical protein